MGSGGEGLADDVTGHGGRGGDAEEACDGREDVGLGDRPDLAATGDARPPGEEDGVHAAAVREETVVAEANRRRHRLHNHVAEGEGSGSSRVPGPDRGRRRSVRRCPCRSRRRDRTPRTPLGCPVAGSTLESRARRARSSTADRSARRHDPVAPVDAVDRQVEVSSRGAPRSWCAPGRSHRCGVRASSPACSSTALGLKRLPVPSMPWSLTRTTAGVGTCRREDVPEPCVSQLEDACVERPQPCREVRVVTRAARVQDAHPDVPGAVGHRGVVQEQVGVPAPQGVARAPLEYLEVQPDDLEHPALRLAAAVLPEGWAKDTVFHRPGRRRRGSRRRPRGTSRSRLQSSVPLSPFTLRW